MRLPKSLSDAVSLCRFCQREQLDCADVARLIVLARRAFHAGERWCNEGTDATNKRRNNAHEQFERMALALGYGTGWAGLWPTLTKPAPEGNSVPGPTYVHLPDVG